MERHMSSEVTGERQAGLEPDPGRTHPAAGGAERARFRIGVFAAIEGDGRYLLARRADIGWWNLPGGGLEYDETPEQGLAREVREEVGAWIEIVRLVGVYAKPQKRELVLTFLCRLSPDSPPPGASEEVAEVAWFLPECLPDQLLPKHRQRLADAAQGRPEAIVRAQTTSTEEDQALP
jgi:ADP-ribose pyrophosphatase YjhB (NUDIX family)